MTCSIQSASERTSGEQSKDLFNLPASRVVHVFLNKIPLREKTTQLCLHII